MGWFDTIKIPNSQNASTYIGFPEDQDDWLCEHWKQYHSANKNLYGVQYANDIVMLDISKLNMFADFESCNYDCDWLQYFLDNGLDFRDFLGNIYCTFDNVSDTVYNVSQSLSKKGSILPFALGGFALLVIFKNDIIKAFK